jgi:hypothetical protein
VVIVVGEDSYLDLDELIDLLAAYGHESIVQSTDVPTLEGFAREAALHLDLRFGWQGRRTAPGQSMEFPRAGCVDRAGQPIASATIPDEIKLAQAFLVAARAQGGPLEGPTGGNDREIVREAVDDAAVEYARGSFARRYPTVGRLVGHLVVYQTMGSARQVQAVRG